MKLHTISLKNYRLIDDAEIHLETGVSATVLVGPNNSGKTSVVEAISAFLSGKVKSFAINDFSVRTHPQFNAFESAALAIAANEEAAVALPELPLMRMDLNFRYEDIADDLNVADLLLMDLDETSSEIKFRIELRPILEDELAATFKAFRDKDAKWGLREFLASHLSSYYEVRYYKVAKDGGAQVIASEDAG